MNLLLGAIMVVLFAVVARPDRARLSGADEARALIEARIGAACGDVAVTADGRGAVAELVGLAAIGLIDRHARRWTVRAVTSSDLAHVQRDGATLLLGLRDFGWPRARLTFADVATSEAWGARFAALTETAPSGVPHA